MPDIEVKEIIRRRNQKAQKQRNREEELEAHKKELINLWDMSKQIDGLTKEKQKLLFGSEESAEIMLNSGRMLEECIKSYEDAIEAVHTLAERYSRSTINIAVIGKIGSGKSRLLQSVSGLGNECIPSLPGTSCTGVTSILENVKRQGVTANLTFKTDEDVVHDINDEIRRINNSQLFGEQIHISPITVLDKMVAAETLEPLRVELQKYGESYDLDSDTGKKLSTEEINDLNTARELLSNYLEAWDEWKPYVGMLPEILTDVKDIETFVSKQKYRKYIAVRKAVIETSFPHTDAEIRLIDTVGIGDPAADTKERMEEVLRDESDAVIFVLKGCERTQYPLPEDIPVLDELDKIYEQNKDKNVDLWMAFYINMIKLPDEENTRVKRKSLETYLDYLISCPAYPSLGKNGIRIKDILDMSEKEEVNKKLNCYLKQISDNLLQVDVRLEEKSQILQQKARNQEQLLKKQLKHLTISPEHQRIQNQIADSMDKCFRKLHGELEKYCLSITAENISVLKERLGQVSNLKEKGLDDIICKCCREGVIPELKRLSAFEMLNSMVKEIGSVPALDKRMEDAEFKQDMAEIFVDSLQLDLERMGKIYDTEIRTDDGHFWRLMGDLLLNGVLGAEPIRDAFLSLDQFATDHSASVTKSLFNYYAARFLNPLSASGLQPYGSSDFTHKCQISDGIDNTIGNPDEFKGGLKKEMKSQLDLFLREFNHVFDEQGREMYLVDTSEQMKAELLNFLIVFEKIYNRPWFQIFCELYNQEVILKEERGLLKELTLHEQQINEYLKIFNENSNHKTAV